VCCKLTTLQAKTVLREGKAFIKAVLTNLKDNKRFGPDCFKTRAPFNILTALDMR
jgi:hypothetical protein